MSPGGDRGLSKVEMEEKRIGKNILPFKKSRNKNEVAHLQ